MVQHYRKCLMDGELPSCPKCNGHDFKFLKLPNLLLLHWVINPGLAFNELILGQRIPRVSLECRSCDLPRMERSFVCCPACHAIHDSRIWSGRHGFGNWLGLVCPSCGERIPCLWNIFSLALLSVTAPLWYFPVRYYRQHAIVSRPSLEISDSNRFDSKRSWLCPALSWGTFMFVVMTLAPFIQRGLASGYWNWVELSIGGLTWCVGGFAFGWLLSQYLGKTRKSR